MKDKGEGQEEEGSAFGPQYRSDNLWGAGWGGGMRGGGEESQTTALF